MREFQWQSRMYASVTCEVGKGTMLFSAKLPLSLTGLDQKLSPGTEAGSHNSRVPQGTP